MGEGVKPSEQAKKAGLKSVVEMARLCDVSLETLYNWHKKHPERFRVMLLGCVEVKKGDIRESE